MNKILPVLSLAVFAFGCAAPKEDSTTGAAEPAAAPKSDAAADAGDGAPTYASLESMIQTKCVMCHGIDPKDGVDLRSYESLMKGGEHGAIVVPGKPEESVLIHVLRGSHGKDRMPFKQEPLPEEDIQKVEAWIAAGAKA